MVGIGLIFSTETYNIVATLRRVQAPLRRGTKTRNHHRDRARPITGKDRECTGVVWELTSCPTFARPNDCAMINACPERQVSQHAGQRRRPCDDRSQETSTSLVFRCIHTDAHAGGTARVVTCVTRHNGRVASVSTTLKSANIDHTSLQRTTCARQTSRLHCTSHAHRNTPTHGRALEPRCTR